VRTLGAGGGVGLSSGSAVFDAAGTRPQGRPMVRSMRTDSPDLEIAMRLLDSLKLCGSSSDVAAQVKTGH
jgi:hypothetical protein